MHILIFGNPVDGFSFRGPFDTPEEAAEYAERTGEGDWWLGFVTEPFDFHGEQPNPER